MKKIIAIILTLALCLTFCGCGEKQDKNNLNSGNGIDLSAALTSGKIPELAVALGTSEEDLKTLHNYNPESEGETGFYIIEEEDYTRYLTDVAEYYIGNENKTNGVSAIVCFETAFGLNCNTYEKPEDVKNAFPNVEFTEGDLTEDEKLFGTSAEGATKLSFTHENRKVSFIFLEEQLVSVVLADIDKWPK